MSKQLGRVSTGIVAVISVLAVGLALGGLGYWYGVRDKDTVSETTSSIVSSDDAAPEAAKTKDEASIYCPSSPGAKTFFNELIGLEFCYPASWGIATLGNVPASASVNGSSYEITFSDNPSVTVASATNDYVNTVGRGGRCADPQTAPPDFAKYKEAWVVDGDAGDIQSATRYHVKKDGVYLIQEWVGDFGGQVCLSAQINVSGGAYEVVTANYQMPYGSGITTVSAHVANPTVLLTAATRLQFVELVDSIRRP